MTQPSHLDLAKALDSLHKELVELRKDVADEFGHLRDEVKPVIDLYNAGTLMTKIIKWTIGVFAGMAAVAGAFIAWWQYRGS